ncbi:MAG: P-loop ATPase, Sll1717 family [Bacteroidota bacterium]
MLPISELNLGFNDAENYKRRENKELFNKIFERTEYLDKLLKDNIFFLLGEKGTGKTAYAVYLSNNNYKNTNARINYIRETEYQKFINLKKEKQLQLSDYSNIWKVIIYLLLAEKISTDEGDNKLLRSFTKFNNLKKAIDEYYTHAFSPEIKYAINFIEDTKLAAELLSKHINVGGDISNSISFSESRFQTNLLFLQKSFEEALRSIKLKHNYILFIDGIDIRPETIPQADYLECIKGLADAVWAVNNDFFSSIKGSMGRMRTVLLMRPDIFVRLNLQNQNAKIRDNAVLLDLMTTYLSHRSSSLFKIVDKLLAAQQTEPLNLGQAWDHYFPYTIYNSQSQTHDDPSFVEFLRFSLYRPRDIVTMLTFLKNNFIRQKEISSQFFTESDFDHSEFRSSYSDYMLGEIKDHLSFYYSPADYEIFLKYFEYLKGNMSFTYDEFTSAFQKLIAFLGKSKTPTPEFLQSPDIFLQFLYELNVLCYREDADTESYSHWCFRERSYSNIAPKVKTHLRYQIHHGLAKALNLGKPLRYDFKNVIR